MAILLPAVRRYETPPGKQAQMDWGICHYQDAQGSLHKVPTFVIILGNSRMKYVEFTSRCDLNSLHRCIVNAFAYYGGMPQEILTDNMKTVVTGREAGKPIWNTRFADFAADIGFTPKVCRVRSPQTKGKVERLVRYVKENFLPGRRFEDLDDLNRQVVA
jgi:transposase